MQGQTHRVLVHAQFTQQLDRGSLLAPLLHQAQRVLGVIEGPAPCVPAPPQVGQQGGLPGGQAQQGHRQVVHSAVLAVELVNGKLHISQHVRPLLLRRSRLPKPQQGGNQAPGIQGGLGRDVKVHHLLCRCCHQGRCKLVDQLATAAGLAQHGQRANGTRRVLHQVLQHRLVVAPCRCKGHQVLQPPICRQQPPRGAGVQHLHLLHQEAAQSLLGSCHTAAGLTASLQHLPADLVQQQLCEPGPH
mmetsp:Transcript_27417/g.59985  ORF Transcript_27417/g.59985 Transcript_27417/m.59985 type:complete len:245 (-) Transcript_27417:677-1411(-)